MHHEAAMRLLLVLLLDQVKEDNRTENHKFERNWLEAKHKAQAVRLFESDDEDAIVQSANEAAQVEESGCESGGNRD
jgi:hypothetical protein